ncbi:hypothetical protein DPMN_152150 [Dreissena polymorpha]|uniref:Uncharacterized protein n=1 Tax=Dreissena polymorpha TaxID=45954 RepID=A0A9D4FGY8_DREPO|nr:hypothetical protein DPMN_152150 [Dreissena polymorpha]
MKADLDKKLVTCTVHTNLRPEIVLWSEAGKLLFVIELNIPWETRCQEAYHSKKAKSTELLKACRVYWQGKAADFPKLKLQSGRPAGCG